MSKIFNLSILFFFVSFSLFSQEGSIRGHVYDQKSGEPVIFANVVLDGTTYGTNTDENGLFTLAGIPLGNYDLKVSYIGYEDNTTQVEFKSPKINYYKINMTSGGINLGVINISGDREQARTEVRVSKLRVSQKQIKALPSTGGDADILQYLQVLPGIISTGDQGGQVYIRGGSPVQNKILLDGLTIYNPFHSIGFYSTFETELIRNVDVLTGGFNAEYGGRISAIIDISTREGNKKRFGGQLSASPFMVKGLFEGPLVKLKDDSGSISFVLSTKQSIIENTSKEIYSYASVNDTIGLPFGFSDTYGKLSFVTQNGSKFNFFGFKFDDTFDNPLVSRVDWSNEGGGMTFDLLPNASSLTLNGIVGYSKYDVSIIEGDDDPRSSLIREYLLGLDFNYFGNSFALKYGLEIKSIRTEFNFVNPFGLGLNQFQNTTEMSGFLKFRKSWEKLVFEPGLRTQFYASLGEISLEPRLGLKWNVSERTRVKAAAGFYTQNVISTSNERDVVSLFTGFLSGPESQFNNFEGERVSSKLQKSRHLILGVEQDISDHLQLNVEGYIKDFPQLIVVNRNKTSNLQSDYSTEEGQAYGVDFSAKFETPSFYVWATYTLGFVDRFDGEQEFPTIYDRRHNINFLTTYSFGQNMDWQASIRWNFGSGFPFTKTQAFFNQLNLEQGPGSDYITSNPDNVGIIYSDTRNGGRLPYYHRLDASIQKTFEMTDNLNVEAVVSVTNAYDRDNIFYFDRVRFERVNQLPIIPSIGLRLNY
ncbi:MAG: TonB-dependent receptor [Saprospiraceae bacterium]|nr:TonB-dependent receptor [Bacteroidia bacterium]NNE14298.1 TonB-dependent receptor [Saprospiraceae bacterium]NNL92122.1 TonB-dependent receptor [Saprospiraceae bacterium]